MFSLKIEKLPNQGLQQKSPNSALSHNQKMSVQGHYSGDYKKFQSGLQTYHSNL